eukprot:283959-Prymnesium_polylepis.1
MSLTLYRSVERYREVWKDTAKCGKVPRSLERLSPFFPSPSCPFSPLEGKKGESLSKLRGTFPHFAVSFHTSRCPLFPFFNVFPPPPTARGQPRGQACPTRNMYPPSVTGIHQDIRRKYAD